MPDVGRRATARLGREYWNGRARRSGGDVLRAACLDDPVANECIDRVQRRVLARALSELARRKRLAGAMVLDFGCGSGRWIENLRREGCRHVGVDAAADMLALTKGGLPGACLATSDGERLPFSDRTFDLIWSVAVVHHNPYDVQERIVAEMVRVLKSDGAIVLFEGVGPRTASAETYWPRAFGDWVEVVGRHGLSCVWRRGARYMVLASALEKLAGGRPRNQQAADLRQAVHAGAGRERWRRAAGRIDVWLDPYLLRLLPARFQNRAAMIFAPAPSPSRPS
jgi:SAM-dependent methyltransferase